MRVESVDPFGVPIKDCVLISHLHHRMNIVSGGKRRNSGKAQQWEILGNWL